MASVLIDALARVLCDGEKDRERDKTLVRIHSEYSQVWISVYLLVIAKHFVQLIFHIGHPPLQAFIPIRSQAMQQDRLLDGTTSCQRYRIRDYPLTRKNKTLKEIRVMRSGCSPWALTQHYSESVVGKLHHSCSSSWQQLSDSTICTRLNRSE